MKRWLSLLLSLVVSAGGLATLAWATDGWTVWTSERARRQALLAQRAALPAIEVQRETGRFSSLHDFDKPVLVVDFIFTRCTTACMVMGYRFSQLQAQLSAAGHADDIQFLSISFDHDNDGPVELSAYLRRFSPQPGNWSALRIEDKATLAALLDRFGIIVLPEPQLGYTHNTAVYLFRNHQMVGIYDPDDTAQLLRHITSLI